MTSRRKNLDVERRVSTATKSTLLEFTLDCVLSREVEREGLHIQLLIRRQEHTEDDSVQLVVMFIQILPHSC